MRSAILKNFVLAGCLFFQLNSFSQTTQSLKASLSAAHVTCYGESNGSAILSVSGGTQPYTYLWSDGSVTKDLANAKSGLYSVKVTDATGKSTNTCIEILQPAPINVNITAPEVLCQGSKGEVVISATGGTAPYSYKWSDGFNGSTRSGIAAGSYSVTVTDAKGCTETVPVEIRSGSGFSIAVSKTDVKCYGNYEGSAKVSVSGTTGVTYLWSDGSTSDYIQNKPAGTYTVKVTDHNSCSRDTSVTIVEPAELNLSAVVSNDACLGGNADATVSGGVAPYRYFWSNGARTEDLTGLSDGTYFVRVTDKNSCLRSATVEVTGVSLMEVIPSVKNVSCNSDNDGAIDVSVYNGKAPYTFSWSDGSVTEDLSGLSAGSYSVTVKDANNCSSIQNIDVVSDNPFSYEVEKKNISCYGAADGSIKIVPADGSHFTYQWSTGDTSSAVSGLDHGSISVIITSPEGCTKTVEFTIPEPEKLSASANAVSDTCAGGKIDVVVSGGTAPFTYVWSDGSETENLYGLNSGYYSVVVTDKNGCKDSTGTYVEGTELSKLTVNTTPASCYGVADGTAEVSVSGTKSPYLISWSNGVTSARTENLSAGNYTVKVTDNRKCVYFETATVAEPEQLLAYIFKTEPTCFNSSDGILRTIVRGGTSPYNFNWTHGATTSNVYGLAAGNYSLNLTDFNGCATTASSELINPEQVKIASVTSNNCIGSSALVTVSGGKPEYKVLWYDGLTGTARKDLTAGTYTVSVTDASGCKTSSDVVIPVYYAVTVTAKAEGNVATAVASGGKAPYSYLWSSGHSTAVANNLPDGQHSVIATDAEGCTAKTTVTIKNTTAKPLSAVIDCCQDQTICKGEKVSIPVHFTGQAPYTFSYQAGTEVKTVTTSQNPYFIETTLSKTTTISLVSVSNGCSSGTVCGRATIGVNDCGTRCEMTCFSADIAEVNEYGDCREVKMIVRSNGSCRYGLSHLSVSVPCGTIGKVSNSKGYQIEKSTDPTSGIKGFKIDNICNFGESKNGKPESFTVTYTVCKAAGGCFGDFCAPLLAFKASTCVYYVKANYKPELGTISSTAEVQAIEAGEVVVYPNPGQENSDIHIKLPGNESGIGTITVIDFKGNTLLTTEASFDETDNTAVVGLGAMQPGIYLLRIEKDGKQYIRKIDIQ
jgi:hypothetical protein